MHIEIPAWILLAQEQAAGGGQGGILEALFGGPFSMIFLFAFLGIMFLVLVVQPERKRQAEHRKMLESLKPNDRIVTVGGIYATVVQVPKDSDELVVRIDDNQNVRMRIRRSAVSKVIESEGKKGKNKDKSA